MPERLYLAPHHLTVNCSADAVHTLSQAAGMQLSGNFDPRYLTITVDPNQAPSQVRETLLHELLHACSQEAGMDETQEEQTVNAQAPRLLAALRDNPDLVAWLTS